MGTSVIVDIGISAKELRRFEATASSLRDTAGVGACSGRFAETILPL
jgi:hypothetical protein